MNKKFFSAVLMGALLLGGTFVSCQDYDDDIENLQNQIDKLASADALSSKVSELQSAISAAQSAAEAKAAAANTVAEAAKKAAGDADAKAAAAQKAADDIKANVEKAATKEEAADAKAAAAAAQKVADEAKLAAAAAATPEDVDTAVAAAVAAQATKDAEQDALLKDLSDALAAIQEKIDGATTEDALKELAEKITELEGKIPASVVASELIAVVAPFADVHVVLEQAKWAGPSGKAEKELFAKLAEKFPEIANYKKNELLKQGGHLAVIVNPANAELTDKYSFSLQAENGQMNGAKVSNPVKGLPSVSFVQKTIDVVRPDSIGKNKAGDADSLYCTLVKVPTGELYMQTKAAEDCFWTLDVEPATNWEGKYENTNKPAALVVETPEGAVVKTAFAYKVQAFECGHVKVEAGKAGNRDLVYSPSINVLSWTQNLYNPYAWDNAPLFTITNGMDGKYILAVEEPADVVKYGITCEGANLKVANFPSDKKTIEINHVTLTVLGLNGSTAKCEVGKVTLHKGIDANGSLSAKEVTLTTTKTNGKFMNEVRWDVEELEMNAAELKDFVEEASKTVSIYGYKANGALVTMPDTALYVYDAKGKVTTDYKQAKTIGFGFESQNALPITYTLDVAAGTMYHAYTTLTVLNPTTGAIALRSDLCKDGILQITGDPGKKTDNKITYTMADGIKYGSIVTLGDFKDLDADEDDYAATAWLKADKKTLEVYKNDSIKDGTEDEVMNQLYTPRNFKVDYYLFGNPDNKASFEFQAEVVSEVWNEDPTKAIILDATKLTAVFGKKIDLTKGVKNGVWAAGKKRGQTYSFFNSKKTNDDGYTYTGYNAPDTIHSSAGDFVLNGESRVKITQLKYKLALADDPINLDSTYYLTPTMWRTVMAKVDSFYVASNKTGEYSAKKVFVYYDNGVVSPTGYDGTHAYYKFELNADGDSIAVDPNGTGVAADTTLWDQAWNYDKSTKTGWAIENMTTSKITKPAAATQTLLDFFFDYKDSITYDSEDHKASETTVNAADGKIFPVSFAFADPERASHFATISGNTIDAKDASEIEDDVPTGEVELIVKMTVKDVWGMTMVREIPIKLTTK